VLGHKNFRRTPKKGGAREKKVGGNSGNSKRGGCSTEHRLQKGWPKNEKNQLEKDIKKDNNRMKRRKKKNGQQNGRSTGVENWG